MALYIPEIFSESVLEKLDSTLRIGRIATDYSSMFPALKEYGGTVNWISTKRVAEAVDVVKGTPLVFKNVDMKEIKSTIKQIASSDIVYTVEMAQLPIKKEQFVKDVTDAIAKKVDSDLMDAILADAVYFSPQANATTITATEIMKALEPFGDDLDGFANGGGLVVNSRLLPSIIAMPEFTSADKTYSTTQNGMFYQGYIGLFMGTIPVIIANTGTWDKDKNETVSVLAKAGALGFVVQQGVEIVEAYDIDLLATKIAATALLTTKLVDNSGVCVVRKTVA